MKADRFTHGLMEKILSTRSSNRQSRDLCPKHYVIESHMLFSAQSHKSWGRVGIGFLLLMLAVVLFLGRHTATAADLEEGRKAFDSGRYDQCIALAQDALKSKQDVEDWGTLLTDALLIKGRYAEALATATNAPGGGSTAAFGCAGARARHCFSTGKPRQPTR